MHNHDYFYLYFQEYKRDFWASPADRAYFFLLVNKSAKPDAFEVMPFMESVLTLQEPNSSDNPFKFLEVYHTTWSSEGIADRDTVARAIEAIEAHEGNSS